MDKRNSKEKMLVEIKKLSEKLNSVYDAGYIGIEYVGRANYASRQTAALKDLNIAMYGYDNE